MIDVAPIRAAADGFRGGLVALSKMQLNELLDEVEIGQRARRVLLLLAPETMAAEEAGIARVSPAI